MWKTSLLSLFHAHGASAVMLTVLALLSLRIVVLFPLDQQSLACALNPRPFPAPSSLFGKVFYLEVPGEAKICLTVRFHGNPPGGLNLTPLLTVFWHNGSSIGWSACSIDGTSCGAAKVSSTPGSDVLPLVPIHVVWTIDTPVGSRAGDYLLQFGLCSGGGLIGLRIGLLNPTSQYNAPTSLCPFVTWGGLEVTFEGYTGMVPTDLTWPVPLPLIP